MAEAAFLPDGDPLAGIVNAIALDTAGHGRVLTSGQPTAQQLADVARAGYTRVIRLSTLESGLADEAEVAANLGLDFLHIPVVWAAPKREDLAAFFAAMDERKGTRLYVHCAKNYRVSVFMGAYLARAGEWARAQAREHALSVFEPDEVWAGFMDMALAEPRG